MKQNEIVLLLESFSSLVRKTLIQAGYSPDAHLLTLNGDLLESRKREHEVSLLIRLRSLLKGLDPLEQIFFVRECLERRRHYRFWYYTYMEDAEFKRMLGHYGKRIKHYMEAAYAS